MSTKRELFLNHVAQTSPNPAGIEVVSAEGIFLYDVDGKKYVDLDSGYSVSSLGHRHPKIIEAIKKQLDAYMHTTVYGEHILTPQIAFAVKLSTLLDNRMDCIYYTTGGSEAVEIAIKLARKYTGRYEVMSCANAYHGSTIAAESLRSDTAYTSHFLPGLPGISHIRFNNEEDLKKINTKTAAIIMEAVQAEAGVISPEDDYLKKVRNICNETGTLMILDEIQTGFGRCGHLFAFQKYDVEPDVLLMAKAMGGGMPLGGVMARKELLQCLSLNPILGHINTFGGHAVNLAAANAAIDILTEEKHITTVESKEKLFKNLLKHPLIKELRSDGFLMACRLTDHQLLSNVIEELKHAGIIVDYFLFSNDSFRIAPPLVITEEEIEWVCEKIIEVLNNIYQNNQ